jgi:hypothetical protein
MKPVGRHIIKPRPKAIRPRMFRSLVEPFPAVLPS